MCTCLEFGCGSCEGSVSDGCCGECSYWRECGSDTGISGEGETQAEAARCANCGKRLLASEAERGCACTPPSALPLTLERV